MGQVLVQDTLPDLVIASTTTITMATTYLGKQTRISVGGQQYLYSSVITINFATTGINGLDTGAIAANSLYYIYSVQTSNTPGLVASLAAPTTGPTGFTAWKEVGRCRTAQSAATLAAITNRLGGNSLKASLSEYTSVASGITSSGGGAVTIGTGGSATDILKWRQVGSAMELNFYIYWGTTGTAFGSGLYYKFNLPNGLTFLTTGLGSQALGTARLYDSSASTFFDAILTYNGIGNTFVVLSPLDGANIDIGPSSPFTFAINDSITGVVTLPIAEFAGLYT